MRKWLSIPFVACVVVAGYAQQPAAPASTQSHVMTPASAIKWGPASPKLPAGTEMALLEGDPSKPGEAFTVRVRFKDGTKVAPHWHPTDEHVTVLSGTFKIGMGKTVDEASMTTLPAGSYARLPKEMPHYAQASGETVLQLHGVGPFVLNFVNPADDPTMKKTPSN